MTPHWDRGVLATGPPEKSLGLLFCKCAGHRYEQDKFLPEAFQRPGVPGSGSLRGVMAVCVSASGSGDSSLPCVARL